jgi:uncharacterized damage-inducible protein DinB
MQTMNDTPASVSREFVQRARTFLTGEYLPKIERCLEKLNDEQIWWRANPESNSIGNLILHLCGNAHQWIVCGLGDDLDNRKRQEEFDQRGGVSRNELLARLRQTITDVDKTLANFDEAKLLVEYPIQGTTSSALNAIFHVTEHFSMHTGQIILQAKILAQVDLNFYDFSTGKPVHTWNEAQEAGSSLSPNNQS